MLALGRLPRQLDRAFGRFRAAVGEEEAVDLRRRDLVERVAQFDHGGRDDDVDLPVNQVGDLLLNRGDDARVACPVLVTPMPLVKSM